MTKAVKETEAAERRLSSCPMDALAIHFDDDEATCYHIRDRIRFLHYIYVRSDEAVLNGVRCGCVTTS